MNTTDTASAKGNGPLLVALDFSDCAVDAFGFACELARLQGRGLIALHVVHGTVADMGAYRETNPMHPSVPMTDVASRRLQSFVEQCAARDPSLALPDDLRSVLVSGVPANRIIEVAKQEGANLIIMGSHGRTGVARLMLGSVAEAVTRYSDVPVTIVKQRLPTQLQDMAS